MKPTIFSILFIMLSTAAECQTIQRIDSLLTTIYSDSKPGASVAIVEDNKTLFKKSFGVSNIETGEKISSSTNFNICSLTKQFTALSILQLAEKNKLSLTDKLSHFFPEINKNMADAITVKDLLTHSSGIPDHYDYTDTKNMRHAHDSDVLNAIKNADTLYFKPGSKFQYSNTAFCLLALIIEKTSGLNYSDYLKRNIFQPAGMKHTTVWNEQTKIFSPAIGYSWDSAKNKFEQSGPDEHVFFSTEGDGGIYTSVDDYLKWFAALQNDKIFSRKIINEARSIEFTIDAEKKLGYGYGWFIDESTTPKKVYHSGSNGGFRTFSFTIPKENFLIVIFSNRDDIDIEEVVLKMIQILKPNDKPFTKIEVLTS
ncbi:MAG TPA: serine hydrolase domain-containing protein [Parafilimonas sp.]|nr:serine hydrolase domain-containing protein [Parafilimonas sp.]